MHVCMMSACLDSPQLLVMPVAHSASDRTQLSVQMVAHCANDRTAQRTAGGTLY